MVEVAAELLVYGLHHPILGLLLTLEVEIPGLLHIVEITVYHIPHLVYVKLKISAVCQHLRHPFARRRREQMQSVAELGRSQLGTFHIVAIAFVDDYSVGHLHYAALDSLKFVARSCKLYEKEEVHHRMHGGLALPHSDSLHENGIVAGGFTKHYGLTGLARHTAERPGRREGRMNASFSCESFSIRVLSPSMEP